MIIGLGFRARVGKSEVAKILSEKYNFKEIAFADALKRGCMEMFGLSKEQAYGKLKEEVDPYWQVTPRFILQKVGTECLRDVYDKDIWVKAVGKKILEDKDTNWVISDCRFPNEALAIKNWGGYVVRVDREGVGAQGGISGHASENSMQDYKDWDFVIKNNGTLKDIETKIDAMFLSIQNIM